MQKKCKKCGAVQTGARTTCIDCGAVLPKAISAEEEEHLEEVLEERLDDMADDAADFYIPRWAKVLSAICILCFAGAVVFLYVSPNAQYAEAQWVCMALMTPIPAVIELLFPKFVWWIDTIRQRWWFAEGENLRPSRAYETWAKASGVIFAAAAIFGLIALLLTSVPPTTAHADHIVYVSRIMYD